jgi:hypothetical protein
VNIFIFDYRGYGRSDGAASEEGTYATARRQSNCCASAMASIKAS